MNFIKKILNKKNRKFLIVAIASIAAIAFYFYFNKENFSVQRINDESRLSQEERNEIQLALLSIWKNTGRSKSIRRGKLNKCRIQLKKDKMTFEGIKYVQTSLSELYKYTPLHKEFQKNKLKDLVTKFDQVKLIEIAGITDEEVRKEIYNGLETIKSNTPSNKTERRKRLTYIMNKMKKYDVELTEEDHNEIIEKLEHMIQYTNENKEGQKNKLTKYKNMVKNSM
jgi:hypothetical protein